MKEHKNLTEIDKKKLLELLRTKKLDDMTFDEMEFLVKEHEELFIEKGGRIFNANSYRLTYGEVGYKKMISDAKDYILTDDD